MTNHLHFNKIATILLKQTEEISIEKLAILSDITTKELKEVLDFFNKLGFLKNKDNYNKILLNSKAKGK